MNLLCLFLVFINFLLNLVSGQDYYFTEKQKNEIINRHKQRLANEAMKIFESQFDQSSASSYSPEIFNRMINYKGLYENLEIKNISAGFFPSISLCHEITSPLIGFDYQRYHNNHYLLCYSNRTFSVRSFRVNKQKIIFEHPSPSQNRHVDGILQMKFYHKYVSNQLFIVALLSNGYLQQIRTFELVNQPKSNSLKIQLDKEVLHTFSLGQRVLQLNVIHFDNDKCRIVALINSPTGIFDEESPFIIKTDPNSNIVTVIGQQVIRLRTIRFQSLGFLVVANYTHWAVYNYQSNGIVELVNIFRMRFFIKDVQVFNNGYRYYVAIVTLNEQYIYQWKNLKQGKIKLNLKIIFNTFHFN